MRLYASEVMIGSLMALFNATSILPRENEVAFTGGESILCCMAVLAIEEERKVFDTRPNRMWSNTECVLTHIDPRFGQSLTSHATVLT